MFAKLTTRNKIGYTLVNAMQVTKVLASATREETQVFLHGETNPVFTDMSLIEVSKALRAAVFGQIPDDELPGDGEAATSTEEGKMLMPEDQDAATLEAAGDGDPTPAEPEPEKPKRGRK